MYKPKMIGNILANGFAEQEKQVSIAVDTFDFSDETPYRVFFQLEPPDIVPTEQTLIDNHMFYNLILCWNERVLLGCPNNTARFIYGTCRWATEPKDHCDASKKQFAVSYLTSSKTMCPGHYFRHEVFNNLPSSIGALGITKHMSPPYIEDKKEFLYPYMFSVVCENGRYKNWVTEKIVDCLVSRTVPIYWGAPNVSEIFNAEGIIQFETCDELLRILEKLTPEDYTSRLAAIEDNLHRAMGLTNLHARIDEVIRQHLKA
jgi:hypothetical protein